MSNSPIATAADYADALFLCRRARAWLFWLLLLMILTQLSIFFIARYRVLGPVPATGPSIAVAREMTRYFLSLSGFLGLIFAILLALVLLLIVNIMLVGRLIGLAHTVRALLACLLLIALLFPWQAFLNNQQFTGEYRIPGVLYTWNELVQTARFGIDAHADLSTLILKWSRFVVFPLLALLLMAYVMGSSRRGLRLALGETPIAGESLPEQPA